MSRPKAHPGAVPPSKRGDGRKRWLDRERSGCDPEMWLSAPAADRIAFRAFLRRTGRERGIAAMPPAERRVAEAIAYVCMFVEWLAARDAGPERLRAYEAGQ